MDNSKYFYLSAFISFGIFGLFAILFALLLFSNLQTKTYALEKKDFVSVSLVTLPKESLHKSTQKTKPVSSVPVSAPQSSQTEEEDIDIHDLFSDIWTPEIKKRKKSHKKQTPNRSVVHSKLKKTQTNDVESLEEKIEKQKAQQQSSSSADEVNEYLAKIQALVYKYFHVPPNTQGRSVKTIIELDPFGKVLDFRVLQYSDSPALNEEVDKMKARLMNVVFPKNPQNKVLRTTVVLISKE